MSNEITSILKELQKNTRDLSQCRFDVCQRCTNYQISKKFTILTDDFSILMILFHCKSLNTNFVYYQFNPLHYMFRISKYQASPLTRGFFYIAQRIPNLIMKNARQIELVYRYRNQKTTNFAYFGEILQDQTCFATLK